MKEGLKDQQGASMVEFAFVLPLLVLLVFGIIEFGLLLYNKAMLTNASREGARKGVVSQDPRVRDDEIKTVVKNYCQNYVVTFGSDICADANIDVLPTDPRDSLTSNDYLTVTVRYRYDFLVIPSSITGPINFRAVTRMKME